MLRYPLIFLFVVVLVCRTQSSYAATNLPLNKIKLPPGFKIEIYAPNVPGARSLALGDKGTVFVGTRQLDKVYALVDKDHDMKVDQMIVIAEKLVAPNGVAFRNGDLYVAEISRIWKFEDIENHLDQPKRKLISRSFPEDGHHGWKFIRFGPDGMLYVPVGAPCNVCEKEDKRYAAILRMNPDGSGLEIFASGIRNTVGFDWDPQTKELWFTDNGRDNLGDNLPPDELNHAPKPKMHFGFPYCHGTNIRDPEFGKYSCRAFTPAAVNLGPHVASLGMRFYTGKMFPEEYRNQIFIAEHGSWNRSNKIGYRITWVRLKDNQPVSYEVFAEGWLQEEEPWGRPVDLLVMPDGSILVSDDKAYVIYRISFDPSRVESNPP